MLLDELLKQEQREQRIAMLHDVPLFAELFDSDIVRLYEISETKFVKRGVELFRQGDIHNVMYVVISGQIALYRTDADGNEKFVRHVVPGEAIGESALLLGEAHDTNAEISAEAELMLIKREALSELLESIEGLRGRLTPNRENAQKLRLSELRFDWLGAGEVIELFVRKHQWSLIRSAALPIVFAIGVLVGAFIVGAVIPLFGILLLIAGGLLVGGFGLYVYLDWRDDFYVVTNRRLVHVENIPLVRQNRSEAPINRVQGVVYERNGVLATVLDFGNLTVETFSGSVSMKDVPQPEDVKNVIFREVERQTSTSRAKARQEIRNELERRIVQEREGYEAPPEQAPPPPVTAESEDAYQEPLTLRSFLSGLWRYFFPKAREEVGETVVFRRHWIALVRKSRLPLLGLFFTFIAFLIWWNRGPLIGLLPDGVWWVWPVLILAFLAWELWYFEDWRNDLYIITRSRIIDLQRTPFLLLETRKESELNRIQSMEVDIPSPWARLFRYGHVIVRIPNEDYNLFNMKDPDEVQEEIARRQSEFESSRRAAEARKHSDELSDWFSAYDHIRTTYNPKTDVNQGSPQE